MFGIEQKHHDERYALHRVGDGRASLCGDTFDFNGDFYSARHCILCRTRPVSRPADHEAAPARPGRSCRGQRDIKLHHGGRSRSARRKGAYVRAWQRTHSTGR